MLEFTVRKFCDCGEAIFRTLVEITKHLVISAMQHKENVCNQGNRICQTQGSNQKLEKVDTVVGDTGSNSGKEQNVGHSIYGTDQIIVCALVDATCWG